MEHASTTAIQMQQVVHIKIYIISLRSILQKEMAEAISYARLKIS